MSALPYQPGISVEEYLQLDRDSIEILSTSTEDYDRGRKFTYYRECQTIQEYVLVNTTHQAIEVCGRERNDLWILHVFGPDSVVELVSLGVHFPISAVYDDIVFTEDNPA
jgi:Uma2 family endonuclease